MSNVYESHKRVMRTPMNRLDYNVYRGWDLPDDEDGSDEGYLVEYLDGGKPNDKRHDGYISWTPKAQFDNGYTEVKEDSFINRLIVEFDKLTKKQDKLLMFLGSGASAGITPATRILLGKQTTIMQEYIDILAVRIELVTK